MHNMLKAAGKAIRNMMEYRPTVLDASDQAIAQVMRLHGAAR